MGVQLLRAANCTLDASRSADRQAALLPLTYKYLAAPIDTFLDALPYGYDHATDGLKSSTRVELASYSAAQCLSQSPRLRWR